MYSIFTVQTGVQVDVKVRVPLTYKSDSSVIVGDALLVVKLFNAVGINPKSSVADAFIANVLPAVIMFPYVYDNVPVL
jgi:hypothetical protein